MKPIQLGILGCGSFVQRRILPILNKIPSLKVVCIQKQDITLAKEIAKKFHIPNAVESRKDLLADPNVEAVFIATPNYMHEDDAIACAESLKPTLCEKPLAPSVAAVRRMMEAFEKRSLPLYVGQSLRFKPSIQKAKHLLHSEILGTLLSIKAYFSLPVPKENWRHLKTRGGGVLQDIGVHLIDFIRFVSNEEIVSVSAIANQEYQKNASLAEQTVSAICRLSSGAISSFECSFAQPFYNGFEVIGSKSRLISTYSLRQTNEPIETLCHIQEDDSKIGFPIEPSNIYVEEFKHFAEVLMGKTSSIISASEGLQNQKVIEATINSLELRKEVSVR